jgi:hypothetical protein
MIITAQEENQLIHHMEVPMLNQSQMTTIVPEQNQLMLVIKIPQQALRLILLVQTMVLHSQLKAITIISSQLDLKSEMTGNQSKAQPHRQSQPDQKPTAITEHQTRPKMLTHSVLQLKKDMEHQLL